MINLNKLSFEWDKGNKYKNWIKHKVRWYECEQVYKNMPLLFYKDEKHSRQEDRYKCYGQTNLRRCLYVSFTYRDGNIRVISARDQNKKERKFYAKKI